MSVRVLLIDRAASPRATGRSYRAAGLVAARWAMAQTNPANSRATATQTLLACTPQLDSCVNRELKRVCAFHACCIQQMANPMFNKRLPH
jgi:hypothetical protein